MQWYKVLTFSFQFTAQPTMHVSRPLTLQTCQVKFPTSKALMLVSSGEGISMYVQIAHWGPLWASPNIPCNDIISYQDSSRSHRTCTWILFYSLSNTKLILLYRHIHRHASLDPYASIPVITNIAWLWGFQNVCYESINPVISYHFFIRLSIT